MTRDGKDDGRPGPSSGTSLPSMNVQEHLRATEKIIRALRKDLDYYRSQHDALLKERNDLLRAMTRLEKQRDARDGLELELRFTRDERDRLTRALSEFQRENEKSASRCDRLEADLADERRIRGEEQEAIIYLEAQIEQRESIVELLRAREEFRE